MAADAPAAGQPDALKLHPEERAEFDAVSYDSIQAMRDLGKLQRLERYMRHEGACRRGKGRRASRRVGSGERVRGGLKGALDRSEGGGGRPSTGAAGWLRASAARECSSVRVRSLCACTAGEGARSGGETVFG